MKKNEISPESVWNLYNHGNDATKAHLKELYPDLFLEQNKWYHCEKSGIFFCFRGELDKETSIGFGRNGSWSNGIHVVSGNVYRKLNSAELSDILRQEAIKRGFDLTGKFTTLEFKNNILHFGTVKTNDSIIFDNGVWNRPSNFVTPEINTWYKTTDNGAFLIYVTAVVGTDKNSCIEGHGFTAENKWNVWGKDEARVGCVNLVKATKQEVEFQLIEEAIRRGYKLETIIVKKSGEKFICKDEIYYNGFEFDQLLFGHRCEIYSEGIWHEIVNEKPQVEKWYSFQTDKKEIHGPFYVTKIKNNQVYISGLDLELGWINDWYNIDWIWTELSDEKVKEALLDYANKNYKRTQYVKCAFQGDTQVINTELEFRADGVYQNRFDIWANLSDESPVAVVIFDCEELKWAEKTVPRKHNLWYKIGDALWFFKSDETAFGFDINGEWRKLQDGFDLQNEVNISLANYDDVKQKLMLYAVENYKYGQEINSACSDKKGTVKTMVFDYNDNLMSSYSTCNSVVMFNKFTGEWSTKRDDLSFMDDKYKHTIVVDFKKMKENNDKLLRDFFHGADWSLIGCKPKTELKRLRDTDEARNIVNNPKFVCNNIQMTTSCDGSYFTIKGKIE